MKTILVDILIVLVLLLTFFVNAVRLEMKTQDIYNAKVAEYKEQLETVLGVEIEATLDKEAYENGKRR